VAKPNQTSQPGESGEIPAFVDEWERNRGERPGGLRTFWKAMKKRGPSAAFMVSMVFHSIFALILMDVVLLRDLPEIEDLIIELSFKKEKPKPKPKEKKKRDIHKPEKKVKPKDDTPPVPKPVETPEPEPKPEDSVKFQKEDPLLLAKLERLGETTQESVIAPTPVAKVKVGTPEKARVNIFQGRSGEGKRIALKRGGGTDASENAVKLGLQWLAKHQNQSGCWSTWKFEEHCPGRDKCGQRGTDVANFDPAMTGLALLCYLGAGHTHKRGEYRNTVYRGLKFLRAVQKEEGYFGQRHQYLMYNHSIAALALAEAYSMTRDEELKESLRNAIGFIALGQQLGGGWDYTDAKTGRIDTSITGWVVMALKSAASGNIAIPWQTTFGAMQHFDSMTKSSGEVVYANRGTGRGRKGVGMVAVGMLSRQFLGWPHTDPVFKKMAAHMLKQPPSWKVLSVSMKEIAKQKGKAFNTMYYWYYATLALFQHGGESWVTWNSLLRDMLCRNQRQDGHANGSWNADGRWFGKVGGRIYATTMAILTLEVYYRYLPIYEKGGGFHSDEILALAFHNGSQRQRLQSLKIMAQQGSDMRSGVLRTALDDVDEHIRLYAAEELLSTGDHSGLPALTELLNHSNGFIRSKSINLIAKINDPIIVPSLTRALLDKQEFVAERAATLLIKLTGQEFSFKHSLTTAEKLQIGRKYQDWWQKHADETKATGNEETSPEPIVGKILAVNTGAKMVMLDRGHGNHAKLGMQFFIFREGEFIGAVKITKVIDNEMSICRILDEFTVKAIQENDKAKSQLE
jgi:hypothetical protein